MTELIVFAVTVLAGYLGSILGVALGWPDAGAVFAIATIGTVILWKINDIEIKNKK